MNIESQNHAISTILHVRTSIRGVRTAQDHTQNLAESRDISASSSKYVRSTSRIEMPHISGPRSSLRRLTRAIRTSLCAESTSGFDCAQDDDLAQRTSRKRPANAHKQHTLSSLHAAMADSARISRTDTPQPTVAVTLVMVLMRPVAAVAPVSTFRPQLVIRWPGRAQVASSGHTSQGRPGLACRVQGQGQRTFTKNHLVDVPPPCA